jgi:hypothetical protein
MEAIYSSETSTSPRTIELSTQKTVLFPVTAMRTTSPTWWGLNSVTYHCLAGWAVFVFEENAESSAEQDCPATSLRTCGSNLGRDTNYPVFHGFRQFIQENMVVVPRFVHGHFLLLCTTRLYTSTVWDAELTAPWNVPQKHKSQAMLRAKSMWTKVELRLRVFGCNAIWFGRYEETFRMIFCLHPQSFIPCCFLPSSGACVSGMTSHAWSP